MSGAVMNTDRELWRGPDEGNGAFYADSIHVTQGGGIGINCGGAVIVKPLREWFALANPWKPIETAPKDGTRVLIAFFRPNVFEGPGGEHQNWMTIGSYRADGRPPLTPSAWQTDTGQGFHWTPTHWMPLPAPPAPLPSMPGRR